MSNVPDHGKKRILVTLTCVYEAEPRNYPEGVASAEAIAKFDWEQLGNPIEFIELMDDVKLSKIEEVVR